MALDPAELPADVTAFLQERHLATLTTVGRNGDLHVCAVGFTWDPQGRRARVITSDGSQKVRNVERTGRAAVAQVDGGRWLSLSGAAHIERDPARVADAEARYEARYRPPRANPARVVVVIEVEQILGRA